MHVTLCMECDIKMLIIGSVQSKEEATELQFISKVIIVENRIRDIAKGVDK